MSSSNPAFVRILGSALGVSSNVITGFRVSAHAGYASPVELKGFSRGGARVSEKHANFIVNPKGAASASDIEWLIQHIQRMVYQMKGVVLQTEVRIVGEAT